MAARRCEQAIPPRPGVKQKDIIAQLQKRAPYAYMLQTYLSLYPHGGQAPCAGCGFSPRTA